MKLKDLPQPIKDLAIIRSKQQDDEFHIESHTLLSGMFSWFNSPEGKDFWNEIDKGYFQVFYAKYTYGFKEGDVVEYEDEECTYIIKKLKVIPEIYDNTIKTYITLINENNEYSTVTMNIKGFCNYQPYLIKTKNQTNEQNKKHSRHESERNLSNGESGDRRESIGIQFRERTIENTIVYSHYKERPCLREVQVSKIAN